MKTPLAQLLARKKTLADLLRLAADWPSGKWRIEDPTGATVFGEMTGSAAHEQSIFSENELAGSVKSQSPDSAKFIAALLENWLRQEQEKRLLGAETLHLYREINLIFSFSEKLAAAIGPSAIGQLTLQEAGQIILFASGGVFFLAENGEASALAQRDWPQGLPDEFLREIARNGKSEIAPAPGGASTVLCAALKIGQRVLGTVALIEQPGQEFSAADLKLLSTLAGLAAAALENAVLHEKAAEQALRAQRDQLTLELALKNPFFKKVMAIAEAQCADPEFTVGRLSEKMHLSPSQLQRKIAALGGLTPQQILRDLRLKRAKELLRQPDLNVSEAAWRAGFNDPSYFARLFSREVGCTPSEWKER